MSDPTRVMVVDDSALMREMLSTMLAEDDRFTVIGAARDAYEADTLMKSRGAPDAITLDLEMPGMDGFTFLSRLMTNNPVPVVVVSSRTAKGADASLEALERGAVDVVKKPTDLNGEGYQRFVAEVRRRVRAAAKVSVRGRSERLSATPRAKKRQAERGLGRDARVELVVIGASTGGVEALSHIVQRLPGSCAPIVIAQHMPPDFTARFAKRLGEKTSLTVVEARGRLRLQRGMIVLAPSGYRTSVRPTELGFETMCLEEAKGALVSPNIDHVMQTAARAAGPKAAGVILTGMGSDGAQGLKAMRTAGAVTFAENQSSALVYSMPRAAKTAGAVLREGDLEEIAAWVTEAAALPGDHRKAE